MDRVSPIKDVSDLSPIASVLHLLDASNVPYVSWKNNHEIGKALEGHSDLDLFVPADRRSSFVRIAGQQGWVRVENPVARFPHVSHFLKIGDDCRFYHLHVYFKIVTGESWLKEFVLPLEDFLLSNRSRDVTSGIWRLTPRAQGYVFLLRHLLKGGSVTSRLLYRRQLEAYGEEWLDCRQSPEDVASEGPFDLSTHVRGAGLSATDLRLPNVGTSLRMRASLYPFLRLRWITLSFHRGVSFLRRLASRARGGGKALGEGGMVVAISGIDGAGKSTLISAIGDLYGRFLGVERMHIGKPQGRGLELLRRLRGGSRSGGVEVGIDEDMRSLRGGALPRFDCMAAVLLGLLRLRMARISHRKARVGRLVLVDRWPTREHGKMDGPRIGVNDKVGVARRACRALEQWAYSRMPRADLCYVLDVGINQAIERNRLRSKANKETDDLVIQRFNGNVLFAPLASRVVAFDNSGQLSDSVAELAKALWREMVERN